MQEVEGLGKLLGQSEAVLKALEPVLRYAIRMIDMRVYNRFVSLMAAAWDGIPGGLEPRVAYFRSKASPAHVSFSFRNPFRSPGITSSSSGPSLA